MTIVDEIGSFFFWGSVAAMWVISFELPADGDSAWCSRWIGGSGCDEVGEVIMQLENVWAMHCECCESTLIVVSEISQLFAVRCDVCAVSVLVAIFRADTLCENDIVHTLQNTIDCMVHKFCQQIDAVMC